jgi:hypothetical protein
VFCGVVDGHAVALDERVGAKKQPENQRLINAFACSGVHPGIPKNWWVGQPKRGVFRAVGNGFRSARRVRCGGSGDAWVLFKPLIPIGGGGDEWGGFGDRSRPSHWSGRRALIANQNKENTGYTLARQKPD